MSTESTWMVKGQQLNDYLAACEYAAGEGFDTFKQDPRIQSIFEHCNYTIALNYRDRIMEDNGHLLKKVYTNDLYGGAEVNYFSYGVECSNSTMQYIGVLSNLIKLFGSLDGLRIVEIGGGYGGQCRTIMDVFNPACYHIIDLPQVTRLQYRYLKEFDQVDCFTQPTGQEYDLVISNYALSEIKDNRVYMDEVIRKSKHGYITCNTDFVQLDFPHEKQPDIQGEKETNYILTW